MRTSSGRLILYTHTHTGSPMQHITAKMTEWKTIHSSVLNYKPPAENNLFSSLYPIQKVPGASQHYTVGKVYGKPFHFHAGYKVT